MLVPKLVGFVFFSVSALLTVGFVLAGVNTMIQEKAWLIKCLGALPIGVGVMLAKPSLASYRHQREKAALYRRLGLT